MVPDPRHFKAPYLDQSQCWKAADKFRGEYWPSGEIPVDVLEIAEFDLDLEIRPIAGLKEDADVDALLLGNWTTLLVDQRQYIDERYVNRLKFSIAHELGHYVLHREVFKSIPRDTPNQWIEFMQGMPDDQYGFLEFHAYEFAGRLLVPKAKLAERFEAVLAHAETNGVLRTSLTEAHLSYLCKPLEEAFKASQSVIEKRLLREKLWPLSL
jgi:hypothetical protein